MTDSGGQHLEPGVLISRYEIQEVLGAGGFGITYKAFDTRLHCEVAIKEYLPAEFAIRESDQATVKPRSQDNAELYHQGIVRFLDEARVLAKFKNRHIVRVSDYMELNGTAYLVMDYEEGESLRSLLKKRGGALSETEIKDLFLPILDGLKAVHDAGLLHRDIKPDNIYLRSDGPPVLLDFGAARQYTANQTRDVTAIVTPGYAPFEQYQPSGQLGAWTDLYAIGATLYHCISGKAPLDALSRQGASIDPLPPALEAGGDRYSKVLLQTVDWMLQRQAEERPRSVDEVIPCLQGRAEPPASQTVLEPLPVSQSAAPTIKVDLPRHGAESAATVLRPAGDAGAGGPAPPPAGGGKRGALIIGGILAVLVAAGGAWWYVDDRNRQQAALDEQEAERAAEAARKSAEEQAALTAQKEAEEKAAEEAERLAKAEAARLAAELEAEKQAAEEARLAKLEADRKARDEAEKLARLEAEKKAAEEAARAARAEAEAARIAQLEAEKKAAEEAARIARAEAERKAAEEAARRARLEAEKKAAEEAARIARAEAEAARIAQAEAERMAAEEAERIAQAEAERMAQEEAARQAEADRKAQEESDRVAREEAARIARAEADRKAREEADRKAREEAARIAAEAQKRKEEEEEAALIAQLAGGEPGAPSPSGGNTVDADTEVAMSQPGAVAGEDTTTVTGNVDEFLSALLIEAEQSEGGIGDEPDAAFPSAARPALTAAQTTALLAEAERYLSTSSLVAPEGRNALDIYQKILAADPDNRAAQAGMLKIGAVYEKAASNMLLEARPDISSAIVARGLEAVPGHPGLTALRAQLQAESQ